MTQACLQGDRVPASAYKTLHLGDEWEDAFAIKLDDLPQAESSDILHPSCAGRADSSGSGSIEEPLTPGRTERSSAAAGEQVIILFHDIS